MSETISNRSAWPVSTWLSVPYLRELCSDQQRTTAYGSTHAYGR
jgi:hypothetical protein